MKFEAENLIRDVVGISLRHIVANIRSSPSASNFRYHRTNSERATPHAIPLSGGCYSLRSLLDARQLYYTNHAQIYVSISIKLNMSIVSRQLQPGNASEVIARKLDMD